MSLTFDPVPYKPDAATAARLKADSDARDPRPLPARDALGRFRKSGVLVRTRAKFTL